MSAKRHDRQATRHEQEHANIDDEHASRDRTRDARVEVEIPTSARHRKSPRASQHHSHTTTTCRVVSDSGITRAPQEAPRPSRPAHATDGFQPPRRLLDRQRAEDNGVGDYLAARPQMR